MFGLEDQVEQPAAELGLVHPLARRGEQHLDDLRRASARRRRGRSRDRGPTARSRTGTRARCSSHVTRSPSLLWVKVTRLWLAVSVTTVRRAARVAPAPLAPDTGAATSPVVWTPTHLQVVDLMCRSRRRWRSRTRACFQPSRRRRAPPGAARPGQAVGVIDRLLQRRREQLVELVVDRLAHAAVRVDRPDRRVAITPPCASFESGTWSFIGATRRRRRRAQVAGVDVRAQRDQEAATLAASAGTEHERFGRARAADLDRRSRPAPPCCRCGRRSSARRRPSSTALPPLTPSMTVTPAASSVIS